MSRSGITMLNILPMVTSPARAIMNNILPVMTSPPKPHQYSEYDKSGKPAKNHQPPNAELLSSAKLLADAAKDTLNSDHDKVDKTKVVHAAGDLLNAGSRYGK